jgi:hypothetical protein
VTIKRGREDLHDYQRDLGIPFLRDNPRAGLFADVGLGKAVMLATDIVDHWTDLDSPQTLVTAPVRVAKQTWPTEFDEWEHLHGFPLTLIRAEDDTPEVQTVYRRKYEQFYVEAKKLHMTPREAARFAQVYASGYRDRAKQIWRRKLVMTPTPVHVIGIEQIPWLVQFWGRKWPYRNVKIDESSKFKKWKSIRFRAISSVHKYIHRLHLATASPAPENYMDLFAQIFLLDRGERFGRNITAFRLEYFDYNEYKRTYTLKPGADEKIAAKIADICLPMRAEDYLNLEKPLYIDRPIELDDETRALKEQFETNFIMSLGVEEITIEAINGAALTNKLQQFASGAVYDEDKRVHTIHDEKIADLQQLIDELQGSPILIVYWFKSSLDRLRKSFPDLVVMDKAGNCVKAWNEGKIGKLALNPGSAAHGLNMQYGPGRDIYFFDLPWSRELYEQTIGRLARQGQRFVVRVWHALVKDSMDEIVLLSLQNKGAGQERLKQYILNIRAKIRRMLGR